MNKVSNELFFGFQFYLAFKVIKQMLEIHRLLYRFSIRFLSIGPQVIKAKSLHFLWAKSVFVDIESLMMIGGGKTEKENCVRQTVMNFN